MGMGIFKGKQVLLGITGSIASYKAVDLASKLTQAGAKVDVVMTDAAAKFVSPLSFQSVTGRPASWDMWTDEDHVKHVMLGERADIIVLAPATANTIAKVAHGLADNLLTVSVLAARCPLLVAPAMDGGMYLNAATQHNIETSRNRGAYFAGPEEGRMASGLVGPGRMLEPAELFGHIRFLLSRGGPLKGKKVVVTAGPTQEPIDPVRFLTNHSSGKQGYALAQAALDRGADVTLISGPTNLPSPIGAKIVKVLTAEEMCEAVLDIVLVSDALLMAAAVADFRPEGISEHKLKKDELLGDKPTIELARNPDILMAVSEKRKDAADDAPFPKVVLGFAAETSDLLENGLKKLKNKKLDYISINDVGAGDAGFQSATNEVVLLHKSGKRWDLKLDSKSIIAEKLVDIITPDFL